MWAFSPPVWTNSVKETLVFSRNELLSVLLSVVFQYTIVEVPQGVSHVNCAGNFFNLKENSPFVRTQLHGEFQP